MDKKTLRDKILKQRKILPVLEHAHRSEQIVNNIIDYIKDINYNTIALYYPIHNEVDVKPLLDYLWGKKKNVLLPFSYKNGNMEFKLYEQNSNLIKDDYGIPSPGTKHIFPTDLIDITLVPCVACDEENNRMGYGAGFYDRFLDKVPTTSIGVCFDFQVLKQIPIEKNDKKLTTIITD